MVYLCLPTKNKNHDTNTECPMNSSKAHLLNAGTKLTESNRHWFSDPQVWQCLAVQEVMMWPSFGISLICCVIFQNMTKILNLTFILQSPQTPVCCICRCSHCAALLDWLLGKYSTYASSSRPKNSLSRLTLHSHSECDMDAKQRTIIPVMGLIIILNTLNHFIIQNSWPLNNVRLALVIY